MMTDKTVDKLRDMRVIKKGDYVPDELYFPPWGDGTYRVFKLKKVEDIIMDNIADYPEGENNDQVDAVPFPEIKPPVRLRRWFNVLMLIINLVVAILALLVMPIAVGLLLFGVPATIGGWLKMYAQGLIGVAGIFLGGFYFGFVFLETRKGIRNNITLIRRNIR